MTVPAHLSGNYAPVSEERTETELKVTGTLPAELTGTYVRNGPNPRSGESPHWFVGDGMLHGVRLEGGRAAWYRNRYVDTHREFFRPDGSRDLTAGAANTHVVRHAGRTFALVESSFPYEVTADLDTVGPYDFDGRLTTAMTAHPKICPTTGELHFFGYGWGRPPYLTYHRADAAGELVVSRDVEVPGATMMHDFHLTDRHVVFMDLPIVFSLDLVDKGLPYKWDPSYGARLGVLRRDDPHGAVRWFEIEPCYVFHALNAHEEGDRIVLHVMRMPSADESKAVGISSSLWRWTVDLASGTVREEQLDDRVAEFPRIDDRLAGLPATVGYTVTDRALVRYDLARGTSIAHEFGPGRTPNEFAFAAADDRAGGAGWLLGYVYDAMTDTSDLVVRDAETLEAVAAVHLPVRVPFGFHGDWFAAR
ncbi:carotenoid oxygenase family protein [Yinghuangia seranimata]|uniref:carotenoid oxygenase family protein n=1 Tax=Yinghuangia seranimata TaxID=408067 RepID=UPI00248CB537|nr:carotenoid oxygenase family protein [Yinghuangia seranimata]MDI2130839.1 carotenoid oxygenase family protein [Yinghuangia seranimata]